MTDHTSTTSDTPVTLLAPADEPIGPVLASNLLVRRHGAVWHVMLNRPAQRNAMTTEMAVELRAILNQAQDSGEARVLVLRGAGGHFCSGDELPDRASTPTDREAHGIEPAARPQDGADFGELFAAVADSGLAVVAVIEGSVAGSGIGLACVADVVIAGQHVVFQLNDAARGAVPAHWAAWLVERVGMSTARRLAVTGGKLDANNALALGLVHQVHASGALDLALADLLRSILCNAPQAVASTKKLMAQSRLQSVAERITAAALVVSQSSAGEEAAEGRAADLQHRRPSWNPA